MYIQVGFDISLDLTSPNGVVFILNVHPSRAHDIVSGDAVIVEPGLRMTSYIDAFGNQCGRVEVPADVTRVRLRNSATVHDSGLPVCHIWQLWRQSCCLLLLATFQVLEK